MKFLERQGNRSNARRFRTGVANLGENARNTKGAEKPSVPTRRADAAGFKSLGDRGGAGARGLDDKQQIR